MELTTRTIAEICSIGGFVIWIASNRFISRLYYNSKKRWERGYKKKTRELGKAYDTKNHQLVEELEFQIQVHKLYSPDPTERAAAVGHLVEIGGERAFDAIIARIESKPALSEDSRKLLKDALIELARSMCDQG